MSTKCSSKDGPIVTGDRGVSTLEHSHCGFLPPRKVGFEERTRKPILTDSRVHTLTQCMTSNCAGMMGEETTSQTLPR